MSTRVSRKLRLSLAALGTIGVVVVLVFSALTWLAISAERSFFMLPYKQESWYRFLLPSQFVVQDKPVIMLAGPSTVRENLRWEQMQEAFPDYHIYQGGISVGTIEDVTISLKLIEAAYGEDALPDYVVLGLGPRFLANLPPERPFKTIVNTYSPWSVTTGPNGVELHKKSLFGAALAKIRFVGKQPERFRSALRAWAAYWGRSIEEWPPGEAFLRKAGFLNMWTSQVERQRRLVSPYKFSRSAGLSEEDLAVYMSGSWWESVFDWDVRKNGDAAAVRLRQLLDFLNEHGIGVAVVNMPERSYSRSRFAFEYEDYLGAIRDGIGTAPFLDLSTFSHDDEFHDAEHTIPEGSRRLTNRVIVWVQSLLT
ncbi:hypothetical protein [Ruegeria arenilitoris]|uniref:hypothetical protein n=1 Tax=Ruegeria arenilitoris TaxID=1173585 RepID=UPI00147EAABD|nr:hypothetical protein [Ruegeria arenilitoris]